MARLGWWCLVLVMMCVVPVHAEDLDQAKIHFDAGIRHFNAGQLDAALQEFKTSADLNPRSAETLNNIAAIYNEMGMLVQAEDYFQKARRLNPDYELAHYNLARLYLTLARDEYQHVIRLTKDPGRAEEARGYLKSLDEVLGAEATDKTAAEKTKVEPPPAAVRPEPAPEPGTLAPAGSVDALFQEAKLAHANGDLDKAVERYRQVAEARPNDPNVQYNLGSALFTKEDYEGALAAFDRSIALDPGNAETHHFRGATLEKLGRASEAIEALKQSVAIHDSYKARWLLGVVYEQVGDYASAVQEFEAVARMEPDNQKIKEYLDEARMILAMKGGGEAPAAPMADPWQRERAWLEEWRQAWEARDAERYLSFYSDAFSARGPGGNKDKAAWAAEKRAKLKNGKPKVKISDLRIQRSDDILVFSFVQDYRDRGYADHGLKKLFVREEGGKLRIVSEEWRKL
jgi:tetratricopeptide (TPR) repeat protein